MEDNDFNLINFLSVSSTFVFCPLDYVVLQFIYFSPNIMNLSRCINGTNNIAAQIEVIINVTE